MDARRQLNQLDDSPSISQLAGACGFNSKASFYRAFSKYVGMTPSQYLDRLKVNQTDSATPQRRSKPTIRCACRLCRHARRFLSCSIERFSIKLIV